MKYQFHCRLIKRRVGCSHASIGEKNDARETCWKGKESAGVTMERKLSLDNSKTRRNDQGASDEAVIGRWRQAQMCKAVSIKGIKM